MDNLPSIDPQAIIFIVVVIIGFLQSIFTKKKKSDQPYEDIPPYGSAPESERDDPLRDFRRMIEDARREAQQKEQQQSPPKPETPTNIPVVIQRPTPQPTATPPTSKDKAEATPPTTTAFSTKTIVPTSPKKQSDELSIKSLLSSPSAARQAIILTEVLGPPKGLR